VLTLLLNPPLLVSLGLGLVLVIGGNLLARRHLGRVRGAVTVFALTVLVYLPYAAWRWKGADVLAIHLALFLTSSLAFGLIQREPEDAPRAPRLYVLVLGGFAALVILVNVIMVTVSDGGLHGRLATFALPEPRGGGSVSSRFPGTVTPDVGHRQALYQHHLEQIEGQTELGWGIRKGWLGSPQAGRTTVFQVLLDDREGGPLGGARLSGMFLRASDPRQDQAFVMSEPSPGVYRVELNLPAPGLWSLLLRIEHAGERFELRGSTTVSVAAGAWGFPASAAGLG
jgi:hypothetical protein